MRRLKPLVIGLALVATMSGAAFAQQAPKPATSDPFQEVVVDGYTFAVDPFFICDVYLISRFTHLDEAHGVVSTVTFQPFYKMGNQMVAGEKFAATENELTAKMEVGEDAPCAPREVQP